MIEQRVNEYLPDVVSPPGETLLETIEAFGMSQAELADRMGRPRKTINEIVKGKAAITPDTALQLERVLNVPARFWMNREQHYREWVARQQERSDLAAQTDWLATIPVGEMAERGWIQHYEDTVKQLQEVLSYFGVATPQQWQDVWMDPQVAFRKSLTFASEPGAVAAWLRRGEILAHRIPCQPYDATTFRDALHEIRGLTRLPLAEFQDVLTERCAGAGVAVTLVPQLAHSRISGATHWLSPEKALIQLSLRYKSDEQFWFSFYHEAAHIVLHGKRDVFLQEWGEDERGVRAVDTSENGAADVGEMQQEEHQKAQQKEDEANRFAADFLIDARRYAAFTHNRARYRKVDICAFAEDLGIAPGIVVGRLQHDGKLPYSHCNGLKRRYTWTSD